MPHVRRSQRRTRASRRLADVDAVGSTHPSVSVVIPTYNRASLLPRAVRSVLAQTYPPLEVLVVDNGSTDGTAELLRQLAQTDSRVMPLSESRRGAPAARNLGIRSARGDIIAFQDSDDEWDPRFLESLVDQFSPRANVVFCSFERLSVDGTRTVLPSSRRLRWVKYRLRRRNIISTQTVILDRRLLDRRLFDPSLPRLQDWDLWLSLPRSAKFRHVDRVLARQYIQTDSISSNDPLLEEALRVILVKHWRKFLVAPLTLLRHWAFVLKSTKRAAR